MEILGLAITAVSGIVGGIVAGTGLKDKSLGVIGNSIAGLIGGVAGTYILQAVNILQTMGLADVTLGSLSATIGSGAIGGAILTGIVALIKSKMKS